MATNMLSPGVSVDIQDFSDYVTRAAEAKIGLMGGASRGPIGPYLITSKDQALQTYGIPTYNDFGILSLMFILDKCNTVYYDRIVKAATKATAGNELIDKLLFQTVQYTGAYNNSRIEIFPSDFTAEWIVNPDETNPELAPNSDSNIEKYGVNLADVSEAEQSNYFDVVVTSTDGVVSTLDYCTLDTVADRSVNELKFLEIIVNPSEDATIRYSTSVTYQLLGGATGGTLGVTEDRDDIRFTSRSYDSTMTGWTVTLSEMSFLNTVDYQLTDNQGILMEIFTNLNFDPDSELFVETFINANSNYVTCTIASNADTESLYGEKFTFTAGLDGMEGIDESDIITALDDFSNPETIEVDIIITPGWSSSSVIAKAISICESRQDCMYIVDPPFGLKPIDVTNWSNRTGNYNRTGYMMINSSQAAIYWPWVQAYDDWHKTYIWMPPSPFVAGQITYSDDVSYPWFAPAGLNRGMLTNIVGLEMSPSQAERDLLYGKNNVINPIVNFKNSGIVIWGQKTTLRSTNSYSAQSALNRVNVRRLINYLKKVITAATLYFIFDPNDSYLQSKWISMINTELTTIQSRRGIYDFNVQMNVTTEDIENNRMPGVVMIKPTKTTEYVPITFMLTNQTASL